MKLITAFKIHLDKNRVFGLDVLRFFAITFVVLSHALIYLPKDVARILTYFIFDGVTIFFVLSGFLIGGILIKILEKGAFTFNKLLDFWKRRWFRTLPAYFLVLFLLLALNKVFNENFVFDSSIIKYFLFLQNFKTVHPNFFPEAWSLSVEEWFYLLSAIIIFSLINLFKFNSKNAVLVTIISIILFTTFFRAYRLLYNINVTDINIWDSYYRKQVITRLDSLMYGVLAAYIKFYAKNFFEKYKKVFFISGIILAVIHQFFIMNYGPNTFFGATLSFSMISIYAMLLLPFLDSIRSAPKIILNPITYVSLTSYSMYLINYSLVQEWIIGKVDFLHSPQLLNTGITFCIYLCLVMMISILMYKYFEVPTTKLRDKLVKVKPQNVMIR
ncbi:acyltransferase family protein [Chryseobacterium viscerum]|uniref:Acyltransferase 3 domain-containing protein n=1 Tax=Chryseobacterium viscerum TaxID=1037377 RepID=A0A316WRZ8_9FLAO|nr:acyltransferase [Chryseobacterium viscerum]PWN64234.1 hypothetical protein C1634_006460 [Chryseobacterium viscerum]